MQLNRSPLNSTVLNGAPAGGLSEVISTEQGQGVTAQATRTLMATCATSQAQGADAAATRTRSASHTSAQAQGAQSQGYGARDAILTSAQAQGAQSTTTRTVSATGTASQAQGFSGTGAPLVMFTLATAQAQGAQDTHHRVVRRLQRPVAEGRSPLGHGDGLHLVHDLPDLQQRLAASLADFLDTGGISVLDGVMPQPSHHHCVDAEAGISRADLRKLLGQNIVVGLPDIAKLRCRLRSDKRIRPDRQTARPPPRRATERAQIALEPRQVVQVVFRHGGGDGFIP